MYGLSIPISNHSARSSFKIDGSEFFHNRSDPLDIFHYRLPGHYNEHGYKLLAEHIGSLISK